MNRTKIAAVLSLAMVAASVSPVMADDASTEDIKYYGEDNDSITEAATEATHKVDVSVTVGSSYTVVIPKTITMAGAKNASSNYNLKVYGDIAGDKCVSVVPPTNGFKLSQAGKQDVDASISQDVQKFVASDNTKTLGDDTTKMSAEAPESATTTGTITANGLTAGTWTGSFNFTVSVEALN